MEGLGTMMLGVMNISIISGLVFAAFLLLRPLLLHLLSPQQRVVLWGAVWITMYSPTSYPVCVWLSRAMPLSFRGLLVPRAGSGPWGTPDFLPGSYGGTGAYHLALPGGGAVQVELTDGLMLALFGLWLAGGVAVGLWMWHRGRRLNAVVRRGRQLPQEELEGLCPDLSEQSVAVWVCPGLTTSFVREGTGSTSGGAKYEIFLQEGLTQDQTALILRHELGHIRLWHCRLKWITTIALEVHWWNPLIWLGYRYFCRDLELACDAATMAELATKERRAYAHTLVELASGRHLWGSPLSFGECDAQIRIRSVARWRPRGGLTVCLTGLATLVLLLFFLASPTGRALPQDVTVDSRHSFWNRDALTRCIQMQLPAEDRVAELLYDPGQIAADSQCRSVLVQLEDGRWLGIHCESAGDDTVYLGTIQPLSLAPGEGQLERYVSLR